MKRSLTRVSPVEFITPFRVTWKDLTYTAFSYSSETRKILKDVSGYFESGQITAIMGPSGCGKSTLLGCISGMKKKGVVGTITISTDMNVKFAFIVQENFILDKLTVKESLMFASKLKNESNADHNMIVKEVVKKLKIEKCVDNYPNRCSGGQLKRVLIGIELVAKPNILILDEPTTGLDSVTTWQLIQTLIELTQQSEPVAVVLTIHQPSARLFNLLSKIYLLSHMGECAYFGSPQTMLKFFKDYGLMCPEFTNPSDFALEVASGEHPPVKLVMLSLVTKINNIEIQQEGFKIKSLKDTRYFNQIYHLTIRSLLIGIRDPFGIPLRFAIYIICGTFISLLYGTDSGILSGCAEDFSIKSGENIFEKYRYVSEDIFENYIGLAFICMFGWFAGIFPVLLQFPTELDTFIKEYNNGFYSVFTYFASKVLADVPSSLILPNLGSFLLFYMTGQYSEPLWRVFYFAFIFILLSFNSSALGFLIGAVLAKYPTAIAFLGMLSLVPLILLSGIMIRPSSMPLIFQWVSNFDYMRFGLISTILNIYGFGRCAEQSNTNQTHWTDSISTEQMLQIYSSDKLNVDSLLKALDSVMGVLGNEEDRRSVVLKYYTLNDSDYNFSVFMLVLHMIVFRTLTYLVILSKIDMLF